MSNGERQGRPRLEMSAEGPAPAPIAASSPSQQLLARAGKTFQTTDEKGRRLTLRKPTPLAEFRFVEMLGQAATNDRYYAMALPVLFVVKVDDEDVLPPARKSEFEALVKLLGSEGLTAIQKSLEENFGDKSSEQDFRDEVKN